MSATLADFQGDKRESPPRKTITLTGFPMSKPKISLRELAINLAREKKIELADAQRIVFAAAQRLRSGESPAPSNGKPGRVAVPSLRVLAINLAREKNIDLAHAQRLVFEAAQQARQADAPRKR